MPEIFLRSIDRIMQDEERASARAATCPPSPRSHGWLRRPDLDRAALEAWELPSGEVRLTAALAQLEQPQGR